MGADRRAEIPIVYSAGFERPAGGSLLPAPARTQREGVVGPRGVRGSLQLFLFRRRAATDCEQGARRTGDGEEGLPVLEQSLLRAVGRQRGDVEEDARRADQGADARGTGRALSGSRGNRLYLASRTV